MEFQKRKEQRLLGKKAFITGAGSGLGRAIAIRYAEEGADVALNDINEENVLETADFISLHSDGKVYVHVADVSETELVQSMVKDYFKEWKELDILVNNAGVGSVPQEIIHLKENEFDRLMKINTRSVFLMTKYFGKYMKRRKVPENQLRGKIINFTSQAGLRGRGKFAGYGASKASVVNLTEVTAIDLGKHRITCNVIAPGLVLTPIYGADTKYEDLVSMGRDTALAYKKCGFPEDVAGVAFFLASSDSDWMTGQVLGIDGGQL